jgi:hypothetical protein
MNELTQLLSWAVVAFGTLEGIALVGRVIRRAGEEAVSDD